VGNSYGSVSVGNIYEPMSVDNNYELKFVDNTYRYRSTLQIQIRRSSVGKLSFSCSKY